MKFGRIEEPIEINAVLIVRNTGISGLSIAFDPISNSNKIIIRVEEAWSDGMFPNWSD